MIDIFKTNWSLRVLLVVMLAVPCVPLFAQPADDDTEMTADELDALLNQMSPEQLAQLMQEAMVLRLEQERTQVIAEIKGGFNSITRRSSGRETTTPQSLDVNRRNRMGDATNTNSFPGFDRCVEFIRSGNDAIHEDGYFWLVEHANDYVSELIKLAESESDDSIRVTWIELLGDTCSERCVETLIGFLSHQHGNTRVYSVLSLEAIGVPAALKTAEDYREAHPDEF